MSMRWVDDPSPAMEGQVIALARQAIASRLDVVGTWHSLVETLRKAGQPEAALASVDEALARFRDDETLLQSRASTAYLLGDFRAAMATADRVLALSPGLKSMHLLRCDCLFRLGDSDAADAALAVATGADSDSDAYFGMKVKLALRKGGYGRALEMCDDYLSRHPAHTSATFFKVQALLYAGRATEARDTLALDRLMAIKDLPLAPSQHDGPQFRTALAEEIRRNPTLVPDPAGKSTREGLQTRRLRQPDAPVTDVLLRQLRREVEAYLARMQDDPHPFVAAAPAKARLSAWAVVYGSEGRQRVHHHASGWLSGVYYVNAARADGVFSGALLIGSLTLSDGFPVRHAGACEVEPVPGRLVMFPSYTPHATLPPRDANSRIIVSFDVVPENASDDVIHD